jgi:hypothetical protein
MPIRDGFVVFGRDWNIILKRTRAVEPNLPMRGCPDRDVNPSPLSK